MVTIALSIQKLLIHRHSSILALVTLALLFLIFPPSPTYAKEIVVSILMVSDTRTAPVQGLKDALVHHGEDENLQYKYVMSNAAGDRRKLPTMAAEIISSQPDIAIAGGGVEADALLAASKGTDIPVVFLSVSSSVERGIVASMVSSGNNLTGIETNDTMLTAKRLWFIKKMLPEAKRVFCFHVPSIVPSIKSIAIAQKTSAELGLELQIAEVETNEDIQNAARTLSRKSTDVILLLPVAPTDKALRSIIFPKALQEKIPIFGYGEQSINSGAFASYAGSRYANGQQAARLMHKIINGILPRNIPIETPEKIELIINRNLVKQLDLHLNNHVWRFANQVVEIDF